MCCCIFSPLGNTSPQPAAKKEYLLLVGFERDKRTVRCAHPPLKAPAMLMPYGEIREILVWENISKSVTASL
jgi:hypothetical protein